MSIWRPPCAPQPLSIWRPPCPFGGRGGPQPLSKTALSIWRVGGAPTLVHLKSAPVHWGGGGGGGPICSGLGYQKKTAPGDCRLATKGWWAGLGFRVQGLGFRVLGPGFRVWGLSTPNRGPSLWASLWPWPWPWPWLWPSRACDGEAAAAVEEPWQLMDRVPLRV